MCWHESSKHLLVSDSALRRFPPFHHTAEQIARTVKSSHPARITKLFSTGRFYHTLTSALCLPLDPTSLIQHMTVSAWIGLYRPSIDTSLFQNPLAQASGSTCLLPLPDVLAFTLYNQSIKRYIYICKTSILLSSSSYITILSLCHVQSYSHMPTTSTGCEMLDEIR